MSRGEITIGQMLGVHPMNSELIKVYQYKSKITDEWRDCKCEWDCSKYREYAYETRIVYK